jgi:hypothetical protein
MEKKKHHYGIDLVRPFPIQSLSHLSLIYHLSLCLSVCPSLLGKKLDPELESRDPWFRVPWQT